jgi:nitroreductase
MFGQLHARHLCLYWLPYRVQTSKENTMTPTIDLLRSHIRHFTDEPITQAQREAILDSARAPPASFLQCSSIIRITDPECVNSWSR